MCRQLHSCSSLLPQLLSDMDSLQVAEKSFVLGKHTCQATYRASLWLALSSELCPSKSQCKDMPHHFALFLSPTLTPTFVFFFFCSEFVSFKSGTCTITLVSHSVFWRTWAKTGSLMCSSLCIQGANYIYHFVGGDTVVCSMSLESSWTRFESQMYICTYMQGVGWHYDMCSGRVYPCQPSLYSMKAWWTVIHVYQEMFIKW